MTSNARVGFLSLVRDHVALATSALLIGLIALRVLVISNFDVETAQAIVSVAGTSNILVGGLLGSSSMLLALTLFGGLIWYSNSTERIDQSGFKGRRLLLLYLLVPFVVVVPIKWGLAALIATPFVAIVHYGMSRDEQLTDDQIQQKPNKHETRIVMAMLILYPVLIFITQPWLPAEKVRLGEGKAQTGYVIGKSDDRTAILMDQGGRTRLLFTRSERLERSLCSKGGWWERPPLFVRRPNLYPTCPTPKD